MQFLYALEGEYTFMDTESFEQMTLQSEQLGNNINYLVENMVISMQVFEERVIAIELPIVVELKVIETDPGVRGDTASGGSKPAKLETGAVIRVPFFIDVGEVVRVDTRSNEYLGRA